MFLFYLLRKKINQNEKARFIPVNNNDIITPFPLLRKSQTMKS